MKKVQTNLAGKKLLILGANIETSRLVLRARELGVLTFVADYDDKAPAKKIADYSVNIDCKDLPALEIFIREKKIDGVLVGVADTIVPYYAQLCKNLGYYSYASDFQCSYLSNKENFNLLLKQFELPTIPNFTDHDDAIKHAAFPVMVKPHIGAASKGVTICHEPAELKSSISFARSFSENGEVLIERFMNCDDLVIFYTIIDGEIIPHAMGDRHKPVFKKIKSPVYSAITYPSKHLDTYLKRWHAAIEKMVKFLGIRNAVLTISAFVEGENFYFYDPGFRIQGEAPDIHMRSQGIFDQLQFLTELAISGENLSQKNHSSNLTNFNNFLAATVCVQCGLGQIVSINGLDEIAKLEQCFNISQRLFEGDEIIETMIGTEKQIFARIYLRSKTKIDLRNAIKEIFMVLSIKNQFNENMICNGKELMDPSIV